MARKCEELAYNIPLWIYKCSRSEGWVLSVPTWYFLLGYPGFPITIILLTVPADAIAVDPGFLLVDGLAPMEEVEGQRGSVWGLPWEASPMLGLSSHFLNEEIIPVSLGTEPESLPFQEHCSLQGHSPACFSLLNYPRNTGMCCFLTWKTKEKKAPYSTPPLGTDYLTFLWCKSPEG